MREGHWNRGDAVGVCHLPNELATFLNLEAETHGIALPCRHFLLCLNTVRRRATARRNCGEYAD